MTYVPPVRPALHLIQGQGRDDERCDQSGRGADGRPSAPSHLALVPQWQPRRSLWGALVTPGRWPLWTDAVGLVPGVAKALPGLGEGSSGTHRPALPVPARPQRALSGVLEARRRSCLPSAGSRLSRAKKGCLPVLRRSHATWARASSTSRGARP